MKWEQIDWTALNRLREAYLQGTAGASDYWRCESDLESYDQTFAQRIGWKWDFVLKDLRELGWAPPPGNVLDWGCGSGVAGRAFVGAFGLSAGASLLLADRSNLAAEFARKRAQMKCPAVPVAIAGADAPFNTLLLSHVLSELDEAQVNALLELVNRAQTVLWVEPGTSEISRRLCRLREDLRQTFRLVAPCPHQGACGVMTTPASPHWCHHFAPPPPAVFTDPNWGRFATVTGIDLRSLPVSFLVLDRKFCPAMVDGAVRVLGRPRVYKAFALLLGCTEAGLTERRLTKRRLPAEFRAVKKESLASNLVWECNREEIAALRNRETTR